MAPRTNGDSLFGVDFDGMACINGNSLFGVGFDSMTFGSLERDTAGDFVPSSDIDLNSIAATLAAGIESQCYYTGAIRLDPYRQRGARLRKMRPHRGEHVKRRRVSYSAFGDQEPKITLPAGVFFTTPSRQQPLATSNKITARDGQSIAPVRKIIGGLLQIMAKMIMEVLFGKGSHV
ncbi:hypothetical protein VPNG_07015 [Cytospora leucostoma]|uniref:Uncharacterized protein n=1 Tax=Cytospora leucostoma TaxID=1230097 RepID=A0A423WNX3_9PEZI|nr:hypothetical protein VPNG_07015 [Cytospora leucostoma]